VHDADAAIDWITDRVLHDLAGGETIEPAALQLLLVRYVATGRDDVRDALESALAQAIDACQAPDTSLETTGSGAAIAARAEWLQVFVEASRFSEDVRLPAIIESLEASLRKGWPCRDDVGAAMQSIDACLSAVGHLADASATVSLAIDELERVVGAVYEPGEGLRHSLRVRSGEEGTLGDYVAAASALLAAYGLTARLPYSMLAEELMQFARRSWWNDRTGGFAQPANPANLDFVTNCAAARVLCRLAVLHQDDEYRSVAVIAHQSDYGRDAQRTLEALASSYRDQGSAGAIYGVALSEWLASPASPTNP